MPSRRQQPSERILNPADRRVALWLLLAVTLFFAFFNRGFFHGSDEIGVFETARSLVEEGSLSVPPGSHVYPGPDGKLYNHFAVGQSVLALPFYLAGKAFEAVAPASWSAAVAGAEVRSNALHYGGTVPHFFVGFYACLATGLLAAVFYLFSRRLGAAVGSSAVAAGLLAGTTYVATMSVYFLRHTTEAALILGALLAFFAWRQTERVAYLAWGSALASALLLVRVPALVAAPPLILYLGWLLFGARRDRGARAVGPRALAAVGLPFLVAVALHMLVNRLKWGLWLSSPMLDQADGFTTPLYVGLFGFLFSPGASIFLFSPLLLLSPWLLGLLRGEHREEFRTVLAIVALFLLVCSRFEIWSGLWSAPGPRYLFVATPLLLLPLGLWLDRLAAEPPAIRLRRRLAVVGLAAVGAAVQALFLATRFGTLCYLMDYQSFRPAFGFLFLPDRSPVIGAWKLLEQRPELNTWIWRIGSGWEGQVGRPGIAWLLAFVWAVLLAGALFRTLRAVRAAAAKTGPAAGST